MARRVDPNKLQRIKDATIETIFRYGFKGMSITEVSKLAGVSAGYLYRFYESKEQLIRELITTEFKEVKYETRELLNASETLEAFVYAFVRRIFTLVAEKPVKAKIAAILLLDIEECAFHSEEELEFKRAMEEKLFYLGHKDNLLNPNIDKEDISLILTTISFRYIAAKADQSLDYFNNLANADKIAEICINALRKA